MVKEYISNKAERLSTLKNQLQSKLIIIMMIT